MTPSTIEQLQEQIEKLGVGQTKKDSANRAIVYTTEKNRVSVLQTIATVFKGKYSPVKSGPGWKSSQGSTQIGKFTILVKPAAKSGVAGSLGNLDARVFTSGAKKGKFNYAGEDIDVVTFTSSKQIEKSIIDGCISSPLLGPEIGEIVSDFFKTKKFNWDPGMSPLLLNKLGVYIGEVLIGWTMFQSNPGLYFESNPFKGSIKAFHLPTDPAFSGVDSFIEMKDGSYYGVSSKFGVGAKASFFSNLFEKGIKNRNKMSKSVFKDICDIAAAKGLDYKKSREITYSYGIEKILKLKGIVTATIYQDIVAGKKSKELTAVVNAIASNKAATKEVKDKLPKSVSSFFTRTIADMLNKDSASMAEAVKILAGKDYWQANLNVTLWNKGSLKFKFVKSGKARVKFIGSKSAMDDPTCKQGWINYELSEEK